MSELNKSFQDRTSLTPVTIILLRVKRNKMLNIKTKFDFFGKEKFSKRTNTRSWEGCDHAKILTKSVSSY